MYCKLLGVIRTSERFELMTPGPTNIDPAVMRAMIRTTESHMDESFGQKYREVLDKLKKVMAVEGEAIAIAGSGTLAQEIALANVVRPGDRVLNLVNGYFSGRFADITQRLRGVAHPLKVPWGKAIKPESVREELSREKYKAVTCAHVETSTGVAIPVREIGEVVKKAGATFVVDTVASLGGMEVRSEEWGVDFNVTCSQKCLAVPPGLAILGLSRRGLKEVDTRTCEVSTIYGDLKEWVRLARNPLTGYFATQPVNLIYALDAALDQILAEGLERRVTRHRVIAESFRKAMTAIGLSLAAEEGYAADTVTSVYYPKGVDDAAFRRELSKSSVIVARGFGEFEGRIFRVGHMGIVNANDIVATIGAIERALRKMGHRFEYGSGCAAAQQELERLA